MDFFEILNTLFIGPIKLIFEIIFSLVNDRIGHPGVSVICLSLAINLLVLPLYIRADTMQKKARDKEASLHNGIAHIKKTFFGDEKMMILQTYYRQNDYSPFSALQGSVSLLLQIPFFMAAVQVLSSISVFEGASLGPITDLSKPDGLLVIRGVTLNILPILMTVVNFISSALFSKNYPLKTKIQLYGLAVFFLVFLYDYPSGLVFYWLLNNVFSFIKTLFYKLKNPKKILKIGCSVLGIVAIALTFAIDSERIKLIAVLIIAGIALQIPLVFQIISKKLGSSNRTENYASNKTLFVIGSLFLTVLTGVLIPSAVISASPQEFVDINLFFNPLWYIISSLCLATGLFMVWMRIFYWLANDTAKYFFDRIVLIICGVATINYMFFGTNFGNMSMSLQFDNGINVALKENLINIAIIALVALVLYFIAKFKNVKYFLLTAVLAFGFMSVTNMVAIQKSVNTIKQGDFGNKDDAYFQFTKDGQNVVVIMLDRAMSVYVPYIMEEFPELQEQFSGFTNYSNTISFGGNTNSALPALMGGYEYTPVEMNKRENESLASKHNEAHMVMPVLFSQNGFDVTVSDPIYLDYEWTSNLSFFDDYSNIKGIKTRGKYSTTEQTEYIIESNKRNFFCYSIMKACPLVIQGTIYNNADYNHATSDNAYLSQKKLNEYQAYGYQKTHLDDYSVLQNLSNMTEIKHNGNNQFLFMTNGSTHEPMMLQLPNYTIQKEVDNTGYESLYRETADGTILNLSSSPYAISHYHSNVSALMRIGEWLDYLRENGVYDNTRIIIVSDHGYNLGQVDQLIIGTEAGNVDMQANMPLLMVKDFNATEFTFSDEFMTNADVPTLATDGIITNPTNPFTNKTINSSEKNSHEQYIVRIFNDIDKHWDISINNGNTFLPAQWASIHDNAWDKANWTIYDEKMILKENSVE